MIIHGKHRKRAFGKAPCAAKKSRSTLPTRIRPLCKALTGGEGTLTATALAANQRTALAGVNPLDHYLMFGVYEGRAVVNDGTWG